MPKTFLAFDIETAKVIPGQVSDLKAHRPLVIACAATYRSGDESPRTWFGTNEKGEPADKMSMEDAAELVHFLLEEAENGATILTWNGLGFDFDILAEESGMQDECGQLARGHVDMMFHAFCELGYPIGLDRAAKAMGLPGKSESVKQHLAPQFWAEGKHDQVLEYVSGDVRATLELAGLCEQQKIVRWIARSGKVRDFRLRAGWLSVEDALKLTIPDTSWMDSPMSRDRFMDWL